MNFFDRQAIARRRSQLLLLYFAPTVVIIVLSVYAVTAMVIGEKGSRLFVDNGWQLDKPLFGMVAGIVLTVILVGCLFKFRELSGGGRVVAILLGGSPVNPQTTDPDERRLCDVVQEMSIASGVPVPELFVLRYEQGINSFVAGRSADDTALAVTEGALKLLTRDELQGIVAHEFSHILNGDNSLNMKMIGLLNGIISISLLGRMGLRLTSKFNDFRVYLFLGGGSCVLFAIGWFGSLLGDLIKCAVCRRREEMADASAVQFTRNPEAIASALKKIGGLALGSHLLASDTMGADFIFFGELTHSSPWGFLRTHPPLKTRIQLLDPSFDGTYPRIISWEAQERAKAHAALETDPQQSNPGWMSAIPIIAATSRVPVPQHLQYAASLCASFEDRILTAARDPFSASALVFAALLSRTDSEKNLQLDEASSLTNPALLKQAVEYYPDVIVLSAGQKLALVNLVLPALRQLSRDQFASFAQTVKVLSESDRALTLFEFTLQKTLLRHLRYSYKAAPMPAIQYYAVAGLLPQCAVLLSMLAWNGSDDGAAIRTAFDAGADALKEPRQKLSLLPKEKCSLAAFDKALDLSSSAAMPVKNLILNACTATVASDGVIQEKEAQLLRAIADSLNCPMPPLLGELEPGPMTDHSGEAA